MNKITGTDFWIRPVGIAMLLLLGMFLMGCSSAPDPQPEPSKKEVQQDADRFFDKMKKEESQSQYPE